MAIEKASFIFYKDWANVIKDLPAEVRLDVYDAVIEYALSGKHHDLKPMAKIAFGFIKQTLDRDTSKYIDVSAKRKEAGRIGAEKRWQNIANDSKNSICYDNDNVNEKDKDNDVITEPPKTGIIKMDDYAKHDVGDLYKSYISPEYQAVRENVCMAKHLTMDQVLKLIQQFTMHLKAQGEFTKIMKDYMSHFNNWLNKQPKPEPVTGEPRRKTSAELLKQQGW